ncbi:hypothetical protein C7445_108157 [Alicyclobacillus sacchari]|uniref:Uncharacterized protein n=1 Tax=Alicyclobacillus sacchari TaxID=392010 RepID=A0A4R8LLC2_9BACL|nr:hypothetical protein [Alicyclobacillus sacchari]TDY45332.1 hypothetical protein C7445_108157 [Alicyclobacillus sacchari]GMA56966.1 hypothetical protein GCM10025858_14690 [Alicyclobacillus sacchari]
MGRTAKIVVGVTSALILTIVLWWAHFIFWLPHFHVDAQGDLVSGKTRLILVSKLLGGKSGITVPERIPFWDSIGIVDGNIGGRLWKFTEHGQKYVLYQPSTEMPWQWVYKYAVAS